VQSYPHKPASSSHRSGPWTSTRDQNFPLAGGSTRDLRKTAWSTTLNQTALKRLVALVTPGWSGQEVGAHSVALVTPAWRGCSSPLRVQKRVASTQ